MKFQILLLLFTWIVMVFSDQDLSGQNVNCIVNEECSDNANSCGMAGVPNNWTIDKINGLCKVKDCTQLQNSNVSISNSACKSCNTDQGNQQQNNGNIFSNSAGSNCVNINCAQLAFDGKMNDKSCETCVGLGSKVNYDKSTCILPNSILNSKIIQVTASFLAYLLYI
ncbi:cell surface immobilization antigen SerH6, putative (macronuclear) [Tetrahymena thermophila SB210]|uniref:Cell surface immobilization antigen SerH6, putative n=1 Tax=Tetrahymena thermophila (strain SB210) TaxID=312017 RepID=I7MAX1_TETTS|nr:cell surface immobilization antigen SerH6, putative [Tetrahymena thermophila SB210]EAS06310.2 cell surface immobilization antigen SerH6, putative [Tetrahymena thermophila SB210]|eukprot:XP_001026555.2 cell surface immobilization antigen SerH6, putative [Tetrahymena thermophila SB210]